MTIPFILAANGFGLNFDLFETNIINLAVVIFGLYKFLPNFLGGILKRRREAILVDLNDAEKRLEDAKIALNLAQKDLSAAEQKAARILTDSKARAEAIRLESEKRTVEEMARIKQGATSDLNSEASRVTSQLRKEAARLAVEKALAALPSKLDKKAQEKFLTQSINSMETA